MYGFGRCHFPNISPVGAPPHIGPIKCCCPPPPVCPPVGVGIGVSIVLIAVLILIALGVIF
ncbi:MAG: hypothetical protein Q8912_14000 [Bacillota bacterium]|nr:hypothetical protein [Bacillota bacterium]